MSHFDQIECPSDLDFEDERWLVSHFIFIMLKSLNSFLFQKINSNIQKYSKMKSEKSKSDRDYQLPSVAMRCGNGCHLPLSSKAAGRIRKTRLLTETFDSYDVF